LLLEASFFRNELTRIAGMKRHTREQRIAASALAFWDEMEREHKKLRRSRPNAAGQTPAARKDG
jgi:hypothetical protein